MIVVKIFKENARKFANLTTAVTFEACKRRLRLYLSDLEKVKERIITGGIIDLPDLTLQRDRRINEEKRIRNERRRHLMHLSRKRREEKRLTQAELALSYQDLNGGPGKSKGSFTNNSG